MFTTSHDLELLSLSINDNYKQSYHALCSVRVSIEPYLIINESNKDFIGLDMVIEFLTSPNGYLVASAKVSRKYQFTVTVFKDDDKKSLLTVLNELSDDLKVFLQQHIQTDIILIIEPMIKGNEQQLVLNEIFDLLEAQRYYK